MDNSLSKEATDWREGRRLRAFELKQQGWSQQQIAEANLCCQNLLELKIELRKAKERLRHKRDVILGCIRQPGFEV